MWPLVWILLSAPRAHEGLPEPAPTAATEPAAPAAEPAVPAAEPVAPAAEPAYHRAAAVYAALDAAAAASIAKVERTTIGESVESRPIYAWTIADPSAPVVGKLLVFANIHALEWVPTEVALAFGQDFFAHPIPSVEVWLIPSLNVDGRARVENDLDLGKNVYRRGNALQVDLNRDFAVNRESTAIWKALIPRRYAVSPSALSQPESRAIDTLAARERFDAAVSLHGFGGYFFYPWTGKITRTPDQASYRRLGKVMHDAMDRRPYQPMQLARWAFFFRGLGMEIDHLYGRYGTLSFLVETTRSGIASLDDLNTHFRWYNPRDPAPHAVEGVRYLRALATEVAAGRAKRVEP